MGWSQGPTLNPSWDNSTLCCWLREPHVKVSLGECVGLICCSSQGAELFASLPRLDLIIGFWVGRLQGPYGGGRWGGQSLHPPLLASSSVFSSGLESFSAGLRCLERAFSLPLSPPLSLFFPQSVLFPRSDVCFFFGGCADIPSSSCL